MHSTQQLPVVVIGAGPTGLAAAAELHERGIPTVVLESGPAAGHAVASWGHVSLFSSWDQLVAPAAGRLLAAGGWQAPDPTTYPTGEEWRQRYLLPLWEALGSQPQVQPLAGHRVVGGAQEGHDLMRDDGRDAAPFVVAVEGPDGPQRLRARAVIDASGTLATPNTLGEGGLPAPGEEDARVHGLISSRIPDTSTVAALEGRHAAVVGAGHSAFTALIALAGRATGRTTWLLRRPLTEATLGGGAADGLSRRGALGQRLAALVAEGRVEVVQGFGVDAVGTGEGGLTLHAVDGRVIEGIDRVLSLTGYRPDLRLLAELRLDLDPSVQAPRRLAPLIDPNVHSCGSVPPHGEVELAHPERDVYVVGMKSYGRAPTFLALTGYEQVRSVVAALAGDRQAADRVELCLPETGVCGGAGLATVTTDALPSAEAPVGCC